MHQIVDNTSKLSFDHVQEQSGFNSIIGQSPTFVSIVAKLPRIARYDIPVLIQGETGTGKEVIARAIHHLSPRGKGPFVPCECSAIPLDLLENELFGHDTGAYTGASAPQQGLVGKAEGGTLFLDEINTLPLLAQVKILRFLQEREYRPLGTPCMRKSNLRVLAACNCDLEAKVRNGRFREDLFYRLKGMNILIPPLRERKDDVLLIARHYLTKFSREIDRPFKGFSESAQRQMCAHSWPGNVRELENAIHTAVILAEGDYIGATDIDIPFIPETELVIPYDQAKNRVLDEFEREYLDQVLSIHRGNISQASIAAGKDRKNFFELMRKHNIDISRYRLDSAEKRDSEALWIFSDNSSS